MDSHEITVDEQALIDAAKSARPHAYAPYSDYRVGAALLDENGNLFTGCNVENASFPVGTCAEVNAIGSMVAAGGKRIAAIAVVGGRDSIENCTPCGACRQNILEFADEQTRIILIGNDNQITSHSMEQLLPASFRLEP